MTIPQYRDTRLIGILHHEAENKMVLHFENQLAWEIQSVVDFSLNGFFPQNILLGIYEYDIANLPARIAAEFPVLSYYIHSGENWQIFHVSPQAGLGGIIVCATF